MAKGPDSALRLVVPEVVFTERSIGYVDREALQGPANWVNILIDTANKHCDPGEQEKSVSSLLGAGALRLSVVFRPKEPAHADLRPITGKITAAQDRLNVYVTGPQAGDHPERLVFRRQPDSSYVLDEGWRKFQNHMNIIHTMRKMRDLARDMQLVTADGYELSTPTGWGLAYKAPRTPIVKIEEIPNPSSPVVAPTSTEAASQAARLPAWGRSVNHRPITNADPL